MLVHRWTLLSSLLVFLSPLAMMFSYPDSIENQIQHPPNPTHLQILTLYNFDPFLFYFLKSCLHELLHHHQHHCYYLLFLFFLLIPFLFLFFLLIPFAPLCRAFSIRSSTPPASQLSFSLWQSSQPRTPLLPKSDLVQ